MGNKKTNRRNIVEKELILIGIGLAAFWWFLESAVHVFVFHEGTFVQQLSGPAPHEIWMRLAVVAMFILFSIYAQIIVSQRQQAEETLRKAHEELERRVEERTAELAKANEQLMREIEERKLAEEALRQSEGELALRNRIVNTFLTVSDREMYAEVLEIVLEALKSENGYFGYLDENESLVCPSMTRDIWDQCQIPDKEIVFPREVWGGLWGRSLIEKKTLCSNEPLRVPEGRVSLRRALVVPIVHQGKLMGQMAVANKVTDYDKKDQQLLETIAGVVAPILHARLQEDEQQRKRKRAQEASEFAHAELNQIFETAADGMLVIDKDFNVLRANKTFGALSGISSDETVGKKCYEVFHGPLCHTPECPLSRVLLGEERVECDVEKERHDGTTIPCIVTATPFRAPGGELLGIVEDFKDISERKQAEEELKEYTDELERTKAEIEKQNWLKTGQTELNDRMRGEQDLATLSHNIVSYLAGHLNASIGAIYVANENSKLKLIGSYAYGKQEDLHSEFNSGEGLVGQAALEKGRILLTEVPDDYIRINSGLGDAAPRNIVVFPCLFHDKVNGVVELGTFHEFSHLDLAFLDQAAESIAVAVNSAQSRTRMATLLEQTQNQAQQLQDQQEELRATNEELEEHTQTLKESEAKLQAQQEELRQTNEELEEHTRILEEQTKDIQKKNVDLEKARGLIEEKARELEMSSKYKSEFLSNMSHELRTPLNSILLLSKHLADNKDGNLTEKQLEFHRTIYSSGSDLLTLINEVLDLSKVEAGKMETHVEDMNLRGFATRMKQDFEPVAQEKGLSLNIDLADGLPAGIRTDRQRIEQIVKNLLSNAFKFTSHGSVTLSIGRPNDQTDLSKSGMDRKNAISFSVSDTGQGIPKDKQKLIFEAFQQANGTMSRKYGGSGLGLTISKELTKLLGGEIQLQSEQGRGSTFTVYLPGSLEDEKADSWALPKKTPGTSPIEQPIGQTDTWTERPMNEPGSSATNLEAISDDRRRLSPGDKSILIIEDDPRFAQTLVDLCREKGFKALVAGDGKTGLHFADFYAPSAIILDITLPRMDGWTAMSRLKENWETRHIPVHFISASEKSPDAMKMGAIGFLTKPVSMEQLERVFGKIENVVSRSVKNLLVVEDVETDKKAITELIGNGDVSITAVSTGEEAYDLLKSGSFDCMTLDLSLPDMPGLELLTRIRNDEVVPHIPIIVYTGKELTKQEKIMIDKYAERIIIKGTKSAERLLDETTLFLHRVQENLPEEKRRMLRMIHDKESILKDKKILLVDDDMRNAFALTSVLEGKKMRLLVGKNGKAGLECLNNNPDVDLVLMDIMMPEMDGYEAMREIRKQEKFKELPIIALTAKAMRGDKHKCIEAGANDYLAKPVDTQRLLSMLRVWLY